MPRSMTGFGRSVLDAPFGRITVEIQSVNRKYLEILVSLPREFSHLEHDVRKWVADQVVRGGVSVRLFLDPNMGAIENLLPDPDILKKLKEGWEKIGREIGVDPRSIDLSFLMAHFPSQSKLPLISEEDRLVVASAVEEALKGLGSMKEIEGEALGKDLRFRLKELEEKLNQIEKLAPDAALKMRRKLFEKMEEIQLKPEFEERLLREVALFADRVDITEEITRFRSHLLQFSGILGSEVIGRKMDFLIQEMGRELNTIGSKSVEAKISHLIVEMKSELEKIREQVQNIE